MKYVNYKIVFQEVPNEISLAFLVSGCPLKCVGCHSADVRDKQKGSNLDLGHLSELIQKYEKYITCVLFLGGEWECDELTRMLDFCHAKKLKTCLYTGLEQEDIPQILFDKLDFIKYGPFKKEFGPLNSQTTNQVFLRIQDNLILNSYFQNKTGFENIETLENKTNNNFSISANY